MNCPVFIHFCPVISMITGQIIFCSNLTMKNNFRKINEYIVRYFLVVE